MSNRRLLEISLAPICFGWETARSLTRTGRAFGLSGVDARLIVQSAPDADCGRAMFEDVGEHG
jgi:hypothetical protein